VVALPPVKALLPLAALPPGEALLPAAALPLERCCFQWQQLFTQQQQHALWRLTLAASCGTLPPALEGLAAPKLPGGAFCHHWLDHRHSCCLPDVLKAHDTRFTSLAGAAGAFQAEWPPLVSLFVPKVFLSIHAFGHVQEQGNLQLESCCEMFPEEPVWTSLN